MDPTQFRQCLQEENEARLSQAMMLMSPRMSTGCCVKLPMTVVSPISRAPALVGSVPASAFSSVDLPAPFGPAAHSLRCQASVKRPSLESAPK